MVVSRKESNRCLSLHFNQYMTYTTQLSTFELKAIRRLKHLIAL